MSVHVRNPGRSPAAEIALPWAVRPAAPPLTVTIRSLSPSALICAVFGEVDSWTAPRLRDRLVAQVHVGGPDLVVDLGEVGFLGAAGLGVLVEVKIAAEASGVGFCLVARTRPVLRPLTVTGLDLAFEVYPHVDLVPVSGWAPGRWSSVDHRRRGRARPASAPAFPLRALP
jgi:anti-sigma B factor antagonist